MKSGQCEESEFQLANWLQHVVTLEWQASSSELVNTSHLAKIPGKK